MNHPADPESLLTEVLAPPADFRAALLAETLRLARRRRRFRQVRSAVGGVALLGLLTVFVGQHFSQSPTGSSARAKSLAQPSFALVRTQPLPAAAIISTRSFSVTGWSVTIPKVAEVATASGGVRLINDNELLAMLAGKPAILIRTGPQTEALVFANPEDQRMLLGN